MMPPHLPPPAASQGVRTCAISPQDNVLTCQIQSRRDVVETPGASQRPARTLGSPLTSPQGQAAVARIWRQQPSAVGTPGRGS